MVFGVLKATSGSTDWDSVSTGNKIQVFAQILYGYGYWGPFALEYEASKVDCGLSDLERTLYEYGYVTDYDRAALDPKIGGYFTSELNSAIKENLYCLVIKMETAVTPTTTTVTVFHFFRSSEPLIIKKLTKWTLTSTSTRSSFQKRLLDMDNQAILSEM